MQTRREPYEIRVGDYIEFDREHAEANGVITNMIDAAGEEWQIIMGDERSLIKAMVVQQTADRRFAVWKTSALPSDFCITNHPRYLT